MHHTFFIFKFSLAFINSALTNFIIIPFNTQSYSPYLIFAYYISIYTKYFKNPCDNIKSDKNALFSHKRQKYPSKSPANTCLSHKQPLATHQIPSFSTIPENWIPVISLYIISYSSTILFLFLYNNVYELVIILNSFSQNNK